MEWACKPGSVVRDHLSSAHVAMNLKRATRARGGPPHCAPICPCSGWGLPSRVVAGTLVRSYHTVSAFPRKRGVFFSVALSVGLPRPAVSWHPALWSPDFPHSGQRPVRDREAHSGCHSSRLQGQNSLRASFPPLNSIMGLMLCYDSISHRTLVRPMRGARLEQSQIRLTLPDGLDLMRLLGENDCLLHSIESRFEANIVVRGNLVQITGDADEVQTLTSLFRDMITLVQQGGAPTYESIDRSIDIIRTGEFSPSMLRDDILLTYRGKAIRPKTGGQKLYVDAIRTNTVTFGIGPAGTGKTYLAMAMAVAALKRKEVGRIVLTRPVVEAGENLGYLPGTLSEKVDPYIRPLYDALFDMTDMERGNALIDSGVIEIAPLAYMRGRTLNDSFIILDEAQNTTPEQMKMFLTRLGFASKMVVTGDVTQLDLPHGISGLKTVRTILEGVPDIAFCDLTGKDVVRHSLVARIVSAYESAGQAQLELDGGREEKE